jgi:thymidylate kinase
MALAVASDTSALIERTFGALDDAGVTWCRLRGAYGEPGSDRGEDLDLLVDRAHLQRADSAVRRLGFARLPTWGRGAHRFYLAYDSDCDCWLKVDLDADISYGRYEQLRTGTAAGCLARRERHAGGWRLSPDDAFWTLLLHCLLDKRAFRPAHQYELSKLADAAVETSDLARLAAGACPADWSVARLRAAVQDRDWNALIAAAPSFERAWLARAGVTAKRTSLVNGGLQRSTKLLNLLRRRGLTVALLGPDGAGKSTLADGVADSFFFPVRSIYMGLYQRQRREIPVPGIGLSLRLATLWRNCVRAGYHKARGRLVLYDRFTYDHFTTIPERAPLKSRARRWLLAHACPAPDLTLVLDAPGELLYARKGEHSVAYLEAQRREFRAIAETGHGIEIVDATRDQDDVRREVVTRIWRRYAARWS